MQPNTALYDLVEALKEVVEHVEFRTGDRIGFMDALEVVAERAVELRSFVNNGGGLPDKVPSNTAE